MKRAALQRETGTSSHPGSSTVATKQYLEAHDREKEQYLLKKSPVFCKSWNEIQEGTVEFGQRLSAKY
jgi:hypothetical protein